MSDDEPNEPNDAALEALWARALEDWNEPKTHAALLEYALTAQRLPDLAGRYRALKDDPEKGTLAKKRLDAIVVAATQMLMSTATPRGEKPKLLSAFTVVTAILFVAVVAACGYLLWSVALTWISRGVLLHDR